jgi:uncharacterized membrane protein YfcA
LTIAAVIAVGLAGGVLAGMFGVGGGIVFVPTLALGLGLSQTAAVGSWRQYRYGNVHVRAAAVVGVGSVIGVQIGALVATSLSEDVLRRLFGAFLLVTAAQLVWHTRRS